MTVVAKIRLLTLPTISKTCSYSSPSRHELATELHQLPVDAREFIAVSTQALLAQPCFDDVLEGMFCGAQRLPTIFEGVRARLNRLTNLDLRKNCQ